MLGLGKFMFLGLFVGLDELMNGEIWLNGVFFYIMGEEERVVFRG